MEPIPLCTYSHLVRICRRKNEAAFGGSREWSFAHLAFPRLGIGPGLIVKDDTGTVSAVAWRTADWVLLFLDEPLLDATKRAPSVDSGLDEPTNLDPAGMAEVREMIRGLGTGERTVLLSSHLLHEVEQVCDSVAILSIGKVVAQGKVTDLVRSQAGKRVRLRTTDNAKAIEILSALEWVGEVAMDDESLVVPSPTERSSELSAALGRAEVYVTEMTADEISLEQYFLDITGDDGKDTG